MNTLDQMSSLLLLLTPLAPLLLLALLRGRAGRAGLLPLAALPGLLLALLPVSDTRLDLPWLLFDAALQLDASGRPFLFLTALLWLAAGLYARGFLAGEGQHRRFELFFLLTMTGNLGLVVAGDLLGFYCFFALMSLSAYGLVVHDQTLEACRAGRIYLYLVLLGEVLLFSACLFLCQTAGTTSLAEMPAALAAAPRRDLLLWLLIPGLGIKMGLFPLHFWLPLAHPAAPLPASAVLSGAMIKAGLLGLLRLLPLGQVTLPGWATMLIVCGLLMAIAGAVAGLCQTEVKAVLAYSSISQMGLPLVALGLGLVLPGQGPALTAALGFYAVHHGLAKGALFLGLGLTGQKGAPSGWLLLGGRLLPALALAGAPLTSGSLAKSAFTSFIMATPIGNGALLGALLALATFSTILLMARFLYLINRQPRQIGNASAGMWSGWLLLLAASLLWIFAASGLERQLGIVGISLLKWSWELPSGIVCAAICWYYRPLRLPQLPPGDLLLPLEAGLRAGLTQLRHIPLKIPCLLPRSTQRQRWVWQRLPLFMSLQRAERALLRLPVAGIGFLLILILLIFFSSVGG
jgi:formate hydrogenlyase subunit 3/multisubunit Na+/H+ antiporter MnhD subunit